MQTVQESRVEESREGGEKGHVISVSALAFNARSSEGSLVYALEAAKRRNSVFLEPVRHERPLK